MKSPKPTIRRRIFLSHLVVLTASLILTFIIFNLCINLYIKTSTKKQLVTTAKTIEKSMQDYFYKLKSKPKLENQGDTNRYLLRINKLLKEDKSFFHIDYAIVSSDKVLIYPKKVDIENYEFVKDNLISIINEKKLMKQADVNTSEFYFDAFGERYGAIIYQINITPNSNDGYLIVYSDMLKTESFIKMANLILITILIFASLISLLISNKIAQKISKPILDLSEYAKNIGERKYNSEIVNYPIDDEIGRLSKTMKFMSKRLYNYDTQMKTFIQNASHEIRTPLMSIQGYAEGIKYGVVDDNEKAIEIIIDESKRLSVLVDNLLYLSKIEAPDETFNIEELNLCHIINQSIAKVSGIAINGEKSINFLYEDNNIVLMGDGEKLVRALINILANDLRYCTKEINIYLKKINGKIMITIEDDGPGFEKNQIKHLFDRFFKGKNGNYGLGLAITKSIIEKHGGTIVAENKETEGARFKITF